MAVSVYFSMFIFYVFFFFFFSSRRRHTRLVSDWSSDVCSSDLEVRDHEVHARERGRLSAGEVDLHDLRDGAAALLLLQQIDERAVTQEVGRGLLALLTPGEGTLVRTVFRHQPDMVVAFAVRHERDGLPVRRNGRLGVVGGLLGQLHGVRAGDWLQENLAVTGALRVEYYRLTVGCERRVAVRPR